jgi:nanoRNase/pAp phosphatase (c-di-AMP/oligoRNAs hydrolase)
MPYDVAIIFGAADLEALGSTFTDHTDFFYNTPIINIDHRADNEHFGTVNIVDITAGSVAEVTYELIRSLFNNGVDADIATALYAGIVAGTDSFQKPSTTPRSFQIASELIEREADREAVIQHLVKTKPLSLIKLTGRLYARLRYDEHMQLFWSMLRPLDFKESGASVSDVAAAMRELANNIAGFNAAFILLEEEKFYTMFLLLGKGLLRRRQEIQSVLDAQRDNGLLRVSITANSLEEAEQAALEKVRAILP